MSAPHRSEQRTGRRPGRRRRLAAAVLAIVTVGVFGGGTAHAQGPVVVGAGSTWSANAIQRWTADVARFGLRVNYQANGSSAGRQFFIVNQVDFAVSEIPFQPAEIAALGGNRWAYLPIVAGGTSFMYNLRDAGGRQVTNLRLSPGTVARIFTGRITRWNDPAIVAENPGLNLPGQQIVPVVRSDGSGTSAQLSMFFSKVTPDVWAQFAREQGIPPTFTSNWPLFAGAVGQSGSDGVADYVKNGATGAGAITYVETSYAIERGFPVALVRNASGNYVAPTSRSVSKALELATIIDAPGDPSRHRTQVLDRVYTHPDPIAYPISSYSYMIIRTNNIAPEKGAVISRFIYYFVCDGQAKAEPLGYSPLPPNLVQVAFSATREMPGAAAPPALRDCRNPTIRPPDGGPDPRPTPTTRPGGGSGGPDGSGPGAGNGTGAGGTGRGAGASGVSYVYDPVTGQYVAVEGDAAAGPGLAGRRLAAAPISVRMRGSTGSALPMVLAALALVILVLVPPLVLGLRARAAGRTPAPGGDGQ